MHPAPTSVARARELPEGTRLGRYTLRHRIARGGMAELYLAQVQGIEGFEKLVAIKLVLPHVADEPAFVEMFLDEARLAARLSHPNIVQVLDLGVADGEHFMAMEHVHGQDVRQILAASADRGGLPLGCALTIVAEACAGLHHAHELRDEHGRSLGVVHRDVSPSNVIVRYDGGVKVVDFGIAKAANRSSVTRTGALKGKAGYMSPEQCKGATIDRRSDIFGLGILLFEATTCLRLFYGNNDFAVMNRIIDCDYAPPSELVDGYPAPLEAIVRRALAKDPADRYPTALAMRRAIEDVAHALGLRLSPDDLAVQMRQLFGDVPPPGVVALATPSPSLPPMAPEPSFTVSWLRRRRSRGTAVGVGVGGVALALAGYLAGTVSSQPASERTDEPASAMSPEVPARAATSPVPAVGGADEVPETAPGAAEPAGSSDPVPDETDPAEPDEVVDEPAAEPIETVEAPPRSSKSKRRRKRKSPRKDKAPLGPGSTLDDMMPRE